MRECARLGVTQPSFRVAAETMERLCGIGISDSTVWRQHKEVATQVETRLEEEEQEVPYYVAREDVAAMEWVPPHEVIEGHASVSMDGVKILTRDEGYREVKVVSVSEVIVEPAGQEQSSPEMKADTGYEEQCSNSPEEEKRGRQDGLELTAHSYRAVLGDKGTFVTALKGELARRRVSLADKISSVNDGADWIWDLVSKYLPSRRVEILDWPHAVENLAKAGNAVWGEGAKEAQTWLEQRKTELWNGQLVQVEAGLYGLPRRYKKRGQAVRQVKAYVDQHWSRLQYDIFRAEDRPIGSGAVESAGKNVVIWRMKRGGQRWSDPGATRMLAAVGEVHSGRWDTRMQQLAKAA